MRVRNIEGKIFETNGGEPCVVLRYIDYYNIFVQFLDAHKHTVKTRLDTLSAGSVKNPYTPSLYGVGYMGSGIFKSRFGGKRNKVHQAWSGVIERGYSDKLKEKYPTYKGCSVHSDWHNFQNFAKWYTEQEFYGLGYHLDKDLLIKGNKIYSESTCCLIPQEINVLIIDSVDGRGEHPRGVSFSRQSGKFVARVFIKGKNKFLGEFVSAEKASMAYRKGKEAHVKDVAVEWRGRIEQKVFDRLMVWEPF